jgi:hypothetical protein
MVSAKVRVRPIAALARHIREFFETELLGVVRLGDVVWRELEKADKKPGQRQLHKERLVVDFMQFALEVNSTAEQPPLGGVKLFNKLSGETVEGPLDVATWSRVGSYIKHAIKERTHEFDRR